MKAKLSLSSVVPSLGFKVTHKDMTLPSIRMFRDARYGYVFDFDVFLESKGFNLQREFCWSLKQKQELILTLLKGGVVPQVAVVNFEDKHDVFMVIDGKQRLGAILDFYDGKFPISVGGIDYFYEDLDADAQRCVWNFSAQGQVAYSYPLSKGGPLISDDSLINWFYLLNFTGTAQDEEHLNKLMKNI